MCITLSCSFLCTEQKSDVNIIDQSKTSETQYLKIWLILSLSRLCDTTPLSSDKEMLDGHMRQQLIGNAGELDGQLLLQLRLHCLQHLQAVLAQEQIGGFGCVFVAFCRERIM